jgi:3-hydroxy-9,10-secoandrosta-1,3,5(10)-triene-9,17-dione monooxygenase reductase component
VTNSTITPFDSAQFRHVLGNFPTGVTVISAVDNGEPVGLAVGSFVSVSLEPAMVGFLPDKKSTSWPRIAKAGSFAVNVLGEHQQNLSAVFAARGADKYADVGWRSGTVNGAPILDDVIAWIECVIVDVIDVGDHWFVLGSVHDLAVTTDNGPLVFFRGGYATLTPLRTASGG